MKDMLNSLMEMIWLFWKKDALYNYVPKYLKILIEPISKCMLSNAMSSQMTWIAQEVVPKHNQ